jgi:hypothetical protein
MLIQLVRVLKLTQLQHTLLIKFNELKKVLMHQIVVGKSPPSCVMFLELELSEVKHVCSSKIVITMMKIQ